jgi:polysaccharide deacetylase 2 family uncharacterized protein YibQ
MREEIAFTCYSARLIREVWAVVDDLNKPLGQDIVKKRPQALPRIVPQIVAGILGLSIAAFVAWTAMTDDPLGGEPMVIVAAEPSAPPSKAKEEMAPPDVTKAEAPSRYDGPIAPAPSAPAGKTVNIIDGSTGQKKEVVVPGSAESAPTAPAKPGATAPNAKADTNVSVIAADPRLLETSRHGAIPKIATDGTRVAEAYARAVKLTPGKVDGPHVAIIMTGLGIGAAGTVEALAKLPAPVTFALAPYNNDIDRLAARARGEGHELLLQVPMEPFDFPDNDPGPQALLTSLGADQNVDRLYWLMSRFQGYVGITNYMGARFTATESALSPVLREAAKRGLIYVDDGSSSRSVASQIAGGNNLSFAKGEVMLDAVPTPVEIDRALTRLETLARDHGVAVGITATSTVAIDRIAKWIKAAESRGLVLVPISAVANRPKSS